MTLNNRIRNEIHTQFRGMKTDQLQAYLLNDMDGEGGTPAFISDLAPGETLYSHGTMFTVKNSLWIIKV